MVNGYQVRATTSFVIPDGTSVTEEATLTVSFVKNTHRDIQWGELRQFDDHSPHQDASARAFSQAAAHVVADSSLIAFDYENPTLSESHEPAWAH